MQTFRCILILFLLSILFCGTSLGQTKCQDQVSYQTINLGDGNGSLPFPLTFQFSNDSLNVFPSSPSGKRQTDFMTFKIVSKICDWAIDLAEGKSDYNLILVDTKVPKEAKLNVVVKKGKGKITLQYSGNNELRVFEMK